MKQVTFTCECRVQRFGVFSFHGFGYASLRM
jgi:hypothetical protein